MPILTLPMQDDLKEAQYLRDVTWNQLQRYVLDSTDDKSVNRYEKLSKLYLTLQKQISKLEKDKPKTKENKLQQYLNKGNEQSTGQVDKVEKR